MRDVDSRQSGDDERPAGPGTTRRRLLAASVAGALGGAGCLGREPDTATSSPEQGVPRSRVDHCSTASGAGGDGPLAADFDSRGRYRCAGRPFDNLEYPDRWETVWGSFERDSGTAFTGSSSVRLEAGSSDDRVRIERQFDGSVDLSEQRFSMAVDPGQGDTAARNVRLQLLAPDSENRVDMYNSVAGLRGWFRVDFGPTKVVGDPDLADVTAVRVGSWVGGDRAARFWVDDLRVTPASGGAKVVLTFDDGHPSVVETALPIMEEYGFRGAVATIPWLVDGDGQYRHMTAPQLHELSDAGWDVVSHPQKSEPLPRLSRADQHEAIRESKRWLVDNGFEEGARFVVWPFGALDGTSLELASRYHYLGFCGGAGLTGVPPTGPLTVTRVNGDHVERTKRVVDAAERYDMTATVMYHTVTDGNRRITPGEFRETMRYVAAADVDVVTVSDLWASTPNRL